MGEAADEQSVGQVIHKMVDNPLSVGNALLEETGKRTNLAYTGFVPNKIPAATFDAQVRIARDLENGLSLDIFETIEIKPDASIKIVGGNKESIAKVEMQNGRYKMYLVSKNIIPLAESQALSCGNGQLYQGYIAAKPYTQLFQQNANPSKTSILPYEIHVCIESSNLRYAIVASGLNPETH
ncbi:MAG: hypothetical protein ABJG88_00785 [Litorimonas sp.]